MSKEETIKYNVEIAKVKEDMETINEFIEDMKNNHLYTTLNEKNAIDSLNLYVNDSIPKQVIRDKIEELKYKRDKTETTYYIDIDAKIEVLEELLEEK
jgi:hypothetical protein